MRTVYVQVHLSWDTDEAAAAAHEQWRTNVFDRLLAWNLELPEQFDSAARHVRHEDLHETVLISNDLGRHTAWLAAIAELGVDGFSFTRLAASKNSSSRPSAARCCHNSLEFEGLAPERVILKRSVYASGLKGKRASVTDSGRTP